MSRFLYEVALSVVARDVFSEPELINGQEVYGNLVSSGNVFVSASDWREAGREAKRIVKEKYRHDFVDLSVFGVERVSVERGLENLDVRGFDLLK